MRGLDLVGRRTRQVEFGSQSLGRRACGRLLVLQILGLGSQCLERLQSGTLVAQPADLVCEVGELGRAGTARGREVAQGLLQFGDVLLAKRLDAQHHFYVACRSGRHRSFLKKQNPPRWRAVAGRLRVVTRHGGTA